MFKTCKLELDLGFLSVLYDEFVSLTGMLLYQPAYPAAHIDAFQTMFSVIINRHAIDIFVGFD